jgi:hypothetical protein
MDEREIQRLLRLKRYEQPPPEYFDDFLREFQRRQRAEILREPLWKIALDRVGGFFTDHSRYRPVFGAAAFAAVAVAGWISSPYFAAPRDTSPQVAAAAPAPQAAEPAALALASDEPGTFAFRPVPALAAEPHYVIDARPVSYDRPFRF